VLFLDNLQKEIWKVKDTLSPVCVRITPAIEEAWANSMIDGLLFWIETRSQSSDNTVA